MSSFRFFIFILILSSCTKIEDFSEGNFNADSEIFRAKTYISESQLKNYQLQNPRKIEKIGKVLGDGKLLFINEFGKGIHVFDNTNPSNPINKGFISIPGNRDFYFKNYVLLADNGLHIVGLDIKLIDDLVFKGKTVADLALEKKMVEKLGGLDKVFKFPNFPAERNIFFECPDSTKGIIIEWEKIKATKRPNCYR